jgi:MFS family permease
MAPTIEAGHEGNDGPIPTETTSLLATYEAASIPAKQTNGDPLRPPSSSKQDDATHDDTPLPLFQVFCLCYVRLFEPIAVFSIFPFINQMISEFNIPDADVGFYSGLIESLFSLTQMMFMIGWGRLADHPRIGRKPVLVFSMAGVSITVGMFGFSKSLWQMILFRCAAGIFSGTIVTIRTMLTENSTPKTQARAFSFFAFTGNLGIFIGPIIGGALADPVHQYPLAFGSNKFLTEYPYALPTMVAGAIGLSATLVALFCVKETLKAEKSGSSSEIAHEKLSTKALVKSPGVSMVLYIYGHIMLLAFAYTAVIPIFFFEPVDQSGFGFKPLLISIMMAAGGLAQSIWILIFFPWLQRRYSTGWVLRACAAAYPIFFAIYPLFNILLREDLKSVFWTLFPIGHLLGSGVSMSFTAIQLCLNDVNPHPTSLGTLNALALVLVSGIRAFAPVLFTSIFALGVGKNILGGYLVWLVLAIIALGFTVVIRWLPPNAEGKTKNDNEPANGDG